MMSIPSAENMRGSQSMNVMCTSGSEPLRLEWEKTEASRRTKKASENFGYHKSVTCSGIEGVGVLGGGMDWRVGRG